ncbi:sugar nucleotide-binding protein [Dactylosporangium sp. AC04546]|uniref:SDR family oxidoreductase n=1 Tax=Dactylosporangium sp. AC04546 TaxID=2862460 RepID=UPI001EDE9EC1|nr:sugar nucleotide-binding protein [Dactylosporangium sp. AC04546]WVK88385.1 sugar nucleotide-binding protein [Dactylosporangium sp. AC04546]
MSTVLVVGGSGLLGRELVRQALTAGHATTATYHRQAAPIPGAAWRALDIRDRAAVAALAGEVRPDVVVNAAYQQGDWATTADGGMHVAAAAAAAGARLVHVSSDAVFSGAAESYAETSPPDPVTPYGAAKAAAETAVAGLDPAAIIARTSLIVGGGESLHETFTHALAAGTASGALFTDDLRCPVDVGDLAAALLELAASAHRGVHHVAGADAVSRHELGTLIARRDGLDPSRLPAASRAAAGIPGPLAVRLDCAATQARLAIRLRGAREFLQAA